ncbi:MAG: NAD(P)H-hydrate epimerase [Elusimicrobia bacterium]|nr:NAD(P)H-hydrate epimerase [Elusimicrobiota bacterium]
MALIMPKEPAPESFQGYPAVSAARMKRLDELAQERFDLSTLKLMENAGQAVAAESAAYAERVLRAPVSGLAVVVCCGRGANGGDGLVAARVLRERGATVRAFLCPAKRNADGSAAPYPDYFKTNLDKARAAGVEIFEAGPEADLAAKLASAALVIDALLGTGSSGKPAGAVHHMIQEITRSRKPVIAVDIPSGIHPDTGYHSGVFITAALTLTLGLPKTGLLAPHAKRYVGELKVLDIGYPAELLKAAS